MEKDLSRQLELSIKKCSVNVFNNGDVRYIRIRHVGSCCTLGFTECPLTLAAQLEGCAELIKVLKSGGAHLDYRTKDGITALHKSVRSKNHTALIVSVIHGGIARLYNTSTDLVCLVRGVYIKSCN